MLFLVWFPFSSGNFLLKFHPSYKVKFRRQYSWSNGILNMYKKYTLKRWNTKLTLFANYFTRAAVHLRWCYFQIKIWSMLTRPKEAGRMFSYIQWHRNEKNVSFFVNLTKTTYKNYTLVAIPLLATQLNSIYFSRPYGVFCGADLCRQYSLVEISTFLCCSKCYKTSLRALG